jgi:hypothetical protein
MAKNTRRNNRKKGKQEGATLQYMGNKQEINE